MFNTICIKSQRPPKCCRLTVTVAKNLALSSTMAPHSLPPTKKRKITQKSTTSEFKTLENDISNALANNGSLNSLADAICVMQDTGDARDVSKIVYSLYRSFVLIISNGRLSLDKDEKSQAVKKWILEHLSTYVDYLGGLLQDEEKFLRVSPI